MARHIARGDTEETATERQVREAIQRHLGEDDVLISGLRLHDNTYGDVEIDLIVLMPNAGIGIVEVKGGTVTYADGTWHQTGKEGTRGMNPAGQARSGRHASGRSICVSQVDPEAACGIWESLARPQGKSMKVSGWLRVSRSGVEQGRGCFRGLSGLSVILPNMAKTAGGHKGDGHYRPVAVDLFAGAGGLSLGLEQAGFDVVASLEYDPVHAATHEFNFPQTAVVCDDASEVSVDRLAEAAASGWERHHPGVPWSGEVDLVAGGPPCQGFSWMGKRRVEDERNDLIFHFFRLVMGLDPKYFIMENVPGMASGAHSALLQDLVERFEKNGYIVQEPHILNAANYGAPQDRRRLILMGSRYDCPPAVHPLPTYAPVRKVRSTLNLYGAALPTGPSVADALEGIPDLDDFDELLTIDKVRLSAKVRRALDKESSWYGQRLAGVAVDPADFSHPREWDRSWLTSSMRTVHTEVSVKRFAMTPPGEVETISRFLRLPPEGLCNTLRAGTGGERGAHTSPRPLNPWKPRVISVREAARLHSFPDWFRLHSTKWHGFRQIGNAVPPLLGRAIGHSIIDALEHAAQRPTEKIGLSEEKLLYLNMRSATAHFDAAHSTIPKSRRRSSASSL